MKITFNTNTEAFKEYGMAFQTRHIFQDILGLIECGRVNGIIKDLNDNEIGTWELLCDNKFTSSDILYIYKGNIICHKNKHSIITSNCYST